MKGAYEIGKIVEADIGRDIGDRAIVVGQQSRRMAQPGAQQILMRRDAQDVAEKAQEMKRAQPGLPGGILKINRFMRMFAYP